MTLTPNNAELKWKDAAGNLRDFPNDYVSGEDRPTFASLLAYRDAQGVFQWSSLDLKLDAIRAAIDAVNVDLDASQAGLKASQDETNARIGTVTTPAAGTLLARLQALVDKDQAKETTQAAFKAAFDARDLSTGARQDAAKAVLDAINARVGDTVTPAAGTLLARIQALIDKDQATETTLAALKAAFDGRDLASGAKQDASKAAVDVVADRLGATLTPAAGTTNKHLADLVAKDFATQTTLNAFKGAFDARDLASDTVLAALRDRIGATSLPAAGTTNKHLADLVAKDFATGAKQDALKTAFDTRDLASDTVQAAVRDRLPSTLTGSGNLRVAVQERPEFERITAKGWKDSEEVRFDIPAALPNAAIYTGVAANGTLTTATAWTVVRTDFDGNGNPSRQRIRFSLAWDSRSMGW